MAAGAKRREERSKLLATFLSNLGVASWVAGIIAPLVNERIDYPVLGGAVVAGLLFHLGGQGVLHYVVRSEFEEVD